MRIFTRKAVLMLSVLFSFALSASAVDHGSMKGNGTALYPEGTTENPRTTTLDYKIVTIGETTWAWFKTNNGAITQGANWGAQVRFWSSTDGKTENQTADRYTAGNSTEALVKAASTEDFAKVSFFAAIQAGNSETEKIAYNPSAKNSLDNTDTNAPSISALTVADLSKNSAVLNITGSDDKSDVFYYITGDNGFKEVAFRNTFAISGLTSGVEYTFNVTPIDFSGNEGTTRQIKFTPKPGIGSLRGVAVPMYPQGTIGGNTSQPAHAAVLNYKVVILDGKAWAVAEANSYVMANAWSSQLRYWSSTNVKEENNLLNRETIGDNYRTWGTATTAIPEPLRISFMEELGENNFYETALFNFQQKTHNSAIAGDNTPPVISSYSVKSTGETNAVIEVVGSDDQSDLFYYITGVNDYDNISLTNKIEFTGLEPNKEYTFKVTPIDFSGNQGTPQDVTFSTGQMKQITASIAKDIKIVLVSSETELEYYYEFTDPSKKFYDAFMKIKSTDVDEFEVKPTVSADKSYVYGKVTDSKIAGKILNLNCGYLVDNGGAPDWGAYVMENSYVTAGNFNGSPLMHEMGAGIDPSEKETVLPILTGAELLDVAADHIQLKLSGTDNSGTVYYEISGAEKTVNALTKGDFALNDIKPGKVYDLSIVAKDLSGNVSEAVVVKVKTIAARSNIVDNVGMNYGNTETTTSGGELVSILKLEGNTLTFGCTTASNIIQNAEWRNRSFYIPAVTINDVDYDLQYTDGNNTTATVTFTDNIGDIAVVAGTKLTVKWAVSWVEGATGRAFFTGTFDYVIGDSGQADTEGPSKPNYTINGTTIVWDACTDHLSGVKYYIVTENGNESRIYDLGESSFSYTPNDLGNQITIVAVDFLGNKSEVVTVSGGSSIAVDSNNVSVNAYLNPVTNIISIYGEFIDVSVFDLKGSTILKSKENQINAQELSAGVYILKIRTEQGILSKKVIKK